MADMESYEIDDMFGYCDPIHLESGYNIWLNGQGVALELPVPDWAVGDTIAEKCGSIVNKENDDKLVEHPNHYQSATGLETIDVIKAFTDDLKGIEATDTGNILKYMCRWKNKNGLQDLKKARWYLNHLIGEIENKEKENM
jgi:hypothetical protein